MNERPIKRSFFRFADEVKDRFTFLQNSGFRCVGADESMVTFDSQKHTIEIYHEANSGEIGLAIANKKGNDRCSLSAILRFVQNKRADQYRDYAAHTIEGVARGVRELAEIFRECIDTGFLTNSDIYALMRLHGDQWSQKYALQTQMAQAQKCSEIAWKEKDFKQVVQLLTPFQKHLSSLELKKLEYAKGHNGGNL